MSRLRARTWTPFERRVMYTRAALSGDAIPHRLFYTFHGLCGYPGIPCEILPFREIAARIIRTKGIDLNSAYHRASADVEKHIDPVTGLNCRELVELINELNGKRWKDAGIRRRARASRMRYSPHANRKYPMRRYPVWVRRDVDKVNDVWYDYQPWVPSDSNPNIYVHPAQPPERFTPSRTEIKPADVPDGKPWEVLQ